MSVTPTLSIWMNWRVFGDLRAEISEHTLNSVLQDPRRSMMQMRDMSSSANHSVQMASSGHHI